MRVERRGHLGRGRGEGEGAYWGEGEEREKGSFGERERRGRRGILGRGRGEGEGAYWGEGEEREKGAYGEREKGEMSGHLKRSTLCTLLSPIPYGVLHAKWPTLLSVSSLHVHVCCVLCLPLHVHLYIGCCC